ncbi:hypothetical protein [Xanthomonas oryzae]|nr:hypothetical protein [Xanthomonas oryzae]
MLLPTLHFVVGTHLWEATVAAVLRPQSTQARRDLQGREAAVQYK